MHRAVRTAVLAGRATRQFSSTRCWCESSQSPAEAPYVPSESLSPSAADAATSSSSTSASSAYSLPFDAFNPSALPASPPPQPGPRTTRAAHPASFRSRQKQHLTDSEAQAFADLLGEILPRSMGSQASSRGGGGGIFDILASQGAGAAPTGQKPQESGVGKVQEALMRKVGAKMGVQYEEGSTRWERRKREELTEQEKLRLDGLREELMQLRTDREVLLWGMRNVFGYGQSGGDVFPDPALLPSAPAFDADPSTPRSDNASGGPSSRIYPDLLHLLFLVLRDTHHAPNAALGVFSLAASNPYSYINGCTTALYTEVLRTRWAQGDIESAQTTLDEMRASGLRIDDKIRELVRAIGEAIRIDGERAELRVDALVAEKKLDADLDGAEREREVDRRRFFGEAQRAAWSRMEHVVEQADDELERARREIQDEKRREEYASLASFASGFDAPPREDSASDDDAAYRVPYAPPPRKTKSPYDEDYESSSSSRGASRRGYDFGRSDWSPEATRDEYGNMVLPKRPSFANPFKIRRKGLSKEDKARKDAKHPALWWKK
ncbi:hypothetical protein JCM10213_003192 [Rhodosporidiobolus nylandii]